MPQKRTLSRCAMTSGTFLPWAAAISALVGFHGVGAVRLINEFLLPAHPQWNTFRAEAGRAQAAAADILCPGRPLTEDNLSKNVPAQAARLISTSDPARANSTLLPERVLGPALGGPKNKIEYGVGGFADCQERRWAFGQVPGKANQLAHVNTHVSLR